MNKILKKEGLNDIKELRKDILDDPCFFMNPKSDEMTILIYSTVLYISLYLDKQAEMMYDEHGVEKVIRKNCMNICDLIGEKMDKEIVDLLNSML